MCSVAFSKNGKYLLSAGKNSICKLWELTTSRCLIAYTGAGTTGKQEYEAQCVFNHTGNSKRNIKNNQYCIIQSIGI